MNILVVCGGNTCRSPMAAGLVRELAKSKGLKLNVQSAGVAHHPGRGVAEKAVEAMKELGVDISDDYSKPVTQEKVRWADHIVAIQQVHADYLIELFPEISSKIRYLGTEVRDPLDGPLSEYRERRDLLKALLSEFVESLRP